jgi:hypothetical protein
MRHVFLCLFPSTIDSDIKETDQTTISSPAVRNFAVNDRIVGDVGRVPKLIMGMDTAKFFQLTLLLPTCPMVFNSTAKKENALPRIMIEFLIEFARRRS